LGAAANATSATTVGGSIQFVATKSGMCLSKK